MTSRTVQSRNYRIRQGGAATNAPGTGTGRLNVSFDSTLRRGIAGALVVLMLPGCAVLGGGSKPLDTYELTAPEIPSTGTRRSRLQLLVTEPSALKALDGQNIVIEPQEGVVQYLAGAQWSDRLPAIIQARLVETYERSGRVGGVGRPGEGLAIDYRIIVDIRSFAIKKQGGDVAEVELNVRVLNDRNGVVRASRTFAARSPVSVSGNDGYVDALDRAFDETAVDIVNWTLSVM